MADLTQLGRIAGACGLCILAVLAGIFLLPVTLPFLLGYALAASIQKPVALLQDRTRLPRWLCGGVFMTVLFLLTGSLLYFLGRQLVLEMGSFTAQLPELLSGLAAPAAKLKAWLQELAARAPDGFGIALQDWVDELFSTSSGLTNRLTGWLISLAGGIVSALPDLFLFTLTLILSSFMFCADLPAVHAAAKRLIPQKWQQRVCQLPVKLKSALGGWVKAQIMLMGVTFLIVTAGLLMLRLDYPLLFGALIALIDALPLLGAGTVMIPWSLLMFLRGANSCGIGLLAVYGAAALLRSALEPKLIGKQIGLHPLLTLGAMYTGYQLLGMTGLVLFPIGAILVQQVWQLITAGG